MRTKKEIVDNWLPRYTGKKLDEIGKYILLTNFMNYVKTIVIYVLREIVKEI